MKKTEKINFYYLLEQEFSTDLERTYEINDLDHVYSKMLDYNLCSKQFNNDVHLFDLDFAIKQDTNTFIEYLNELIQRHPQIKQEFKLKE